MAKKIIEQGSTTFHATCSECATRFSYEPEDVYHNYVLGGDRVSCPHCGHDCRHFGNGMKGWGGGGRASWMASCS